MPEPILYDYQYAHIDRLREVRETKIKYTRDGEDYWRTPNVVLQAPTGYGKTHCFTWMMYRTHHRGYRAWVIAHLKELLEEVSVRFTDFGIPHSWIASGKPSGDHPIKLVMAQSVVKKLNHQEPFDWAVEDECHHATASTWGKIREWNPTARYLGTSGTPGRPDGTPMNLAYDAIVPTMQVKELIAINQLDERRGLVQPIVFVPPEKVDFSDLRKNAKGEIIDTAEVKLRLQKNKVTGDLIKHYKKYVDGQKAIVFDVDVESCIDTAEQFNKAGIPADYIDGSMDEYKRAAKWNAYKNGSTLVLVSVNLFLEGVNIPGVVAAFWRRPTGSEIVWVQGNGRIMRPASGKKVCFVFDHVGNTLRHGLPEADRHYNLLGRIKGSRGGGDQGAHLVRCDECHAKFEPAPICPYCGYVIPVKKRELIEVGGELVMAVDDERLQALIVRGKQEQIVARKLRLCYTEAHCVALALEIGRDENFGRHLWQKKNAWKNKAKKAASLD